MKTHKHQWHKVGNHGRVKDGKVVYDSLLFFCEDVSCFEMQIVPFSQYDDKETKDDSHRTV